MRSVLEKRSWWFMFSAILLGGTRYFRRWQMHSYCMPRFSKTNFHSHDINMEWLFQTYMWIWWHTETWWTMCGTFYMPKCSPYEYGFSEGMERGYFGGDYMTCTICPMDVSCPECPLYMTTSITNDSQCEVPKCADGYVVNEDGECVRKLCND